MRIARLREALEAAPGPLMVELLFAVDPGLAGTELSIAVGRRLHASVQAASAPNAVVLSFAGEVRALSEVAVAPRIALLGPTRSADLERYEAAIGQSDWPSAREAVGRHSSSVLITDLAGGTHALEDRIRRFEAVVAASIDVTPALALYWPSAEVLVDPAGYLAAIEQQPG